MNGLNTEVFDKEWRDLCEVTEAGAGQLREMVKEHYLGKWPAIQTCSLAMYCGPFIVGMCLFSDPPKETNKRYGGKTWELARLWIRDDIPRNAESWLIAQAVKHIRRTYPEVRFLVSYADPSAGHTGIVYRAANWTADGRTDEDRKSPRCDYVGINSGRKFSRSGRNGDEDVIRVPRVSKYRYIYRMR